MTILARLRGTAFVNGDPVALKVYGSQAGMYFFINDHLGTPQKIVNNSGQVVWAAAYLPFGKAQVKPAVVENNLRFPGQYFDAESGLHYNRHRYYDPETGRYITADPIGLKGGVNLYAYVMGNPVNLTDPEGLITIFAVVKRIGNWGLKTLGIENRDKAKRLLRKYGKDISGSKKAIKKLSKNKGKGKTGKPIKECHGDEYGKGTEHFHQPDRSKDTGGKGGHGFISGSVALIFIILDSVDPVEIMYGELAGHEDDNDI